MICNNCGNNIDDDKEICSNCGYSTIRHEENEQQINEENINNNITQNLVLDNARIENSTSIIDKIKEFVRKPSSKKALPILGIGILILCFIYVCFLLFDDTKIEFDKKYGDAKTKYVSQTIVNLQLKVTSKKNKINPKNIKIKTTCGKVKQNKYKLKWDLTNSIGNCEIEASYKNKKVTKEVTVISTETDSNILSLEYEIDENSDDDIDYDGLTNKEEKGYKTNPESSDTDMDGLSDYEELKETKTDPTNKDSDSDGLTDYDEIKLGLDPLKADTKGDGVKDGKRTLTYEYENDGIKISITGKGNIASTVSVVNKGTKISSKSGLIDNLYSFYTKGDIEQAIVRIPYSIEEITEKRLNEDTLSLYYYNTKENKYEKIETEVDKENKILIAKLKHFSNYVVGDDSLNTKKIKTQVLFVLDNSWSLYTNEQYKKYTGEEYSGGWFGTSTLEGNDKDGLRFKVTKDLIKKLDGTDYEIGLSEFRDDYANALKIGSPVDKITKKLDGMMGNFITSIAGTDISEALQGGISEFDDDSNKYIVILTDGEDTLLQYYSKRIIEKAKETNVKICSVGFGEGTINDSLVEISEETGCKFFSSSDANGLVELFDNVKIELEDGLVDVDDDNKEDGILVLDSGFIVNRDGFSFENYGTNLSSGGHCYGMATFAEYYYRKQLPLKHESITSGKYKSYKYDLSNTSLKNYGNLYDYKLRTNLLKDTFGYEYFNEEKPADYYEVKNNKLKINSIYKTDAKLLSLYDVLEYETTLDKNEQLKKHGVNYEKYESLLLNEDKMQDSSEIDKTDMQLLNAIYAGFIKQYSTPNYASSSNFVLWLRDVLKIEEIEYTGEVGFLNVLKSRLKNEDPLVLMIYETGGLHAINAISLTQDIDNPNYYYIGVYDNNYPGEKRYIDMECNGKICVMKANEYYKENDKPLRITASIIQDLNYYEN